MQSQALQNGSIAQLVQSICLTSRGSGVRIPLLPLKIQRRRLYKSSFLFCAYWSCTSPPHKHKTKIVFDCFSVSLVWGKGVELGGQGLSRYYSDLLLGFQPAPFLYGIGSTAKAVRIEIIPLIYTIHPKPLL